MLIKVFDADRFQGTAVVVKDAKIDIDLSTGDKQLSFSTETANVIKEEYYIQTEEDEYVVKESDNQGNGYTDYIANLNLEGLDGTCWQDFVVEEATPNAAMAAAISGSGWTLSTSTPDVALWATRKRSFELTNTTTLKIIDKIKEAYLVEVVYNTLKKRVELSERQGVDKGTYFIEGFNLAKLQIKRDTNDLVTRVVPIGADNLTIEDVNNGLTYIENLQYSKKVKAVIWEDTNYTDAQALMEAATAYLAEASKPKVSYTVDILDLATMTGQYNSVLDFAIGDTVRIASIETELIDTQRIVKITQYPDTPEKNTCELANKVATFDDMQKAWDAAYEVVSNTTNGSGIVIGSTVAVTTVDGTKSNAEAEIASLQTQINSIQTNGGDKSYVHTQLTPSAVWTVTHNMNKKPSVTAVDSAGSIIIGEVVYTSSNALTINLSGECSGLAYLN